MKRSSSMRTRVIAFAALGLSACSGSSEPHHAGDAGSSDGEIVVLTSTVVAFASTYTALSVGSTHACGIRADGTIDCWGQPQHGAEPPPEGRFRAVASFQQDCAIATDGTVACWGPGGNGETQPPPGTFTALAAGSMFTCGLMTSGALRCWGRIDPPPAGTFTAIAAGSSSACAIDTDGAVACWGLGGLTLPGRYVQIAMNDRMVCGLTSASRMACSGGDALLGPFSAIAVADTACGVRPDGTITCGGRFGAVNAQDPPPGRYQQLAARDSILCALEEGEVRCWGGLLTNLASARRRHTQWLDVGVGVMFGSGIDGARGCGIAADGTLDCWGPNPFGESSPPRGTFKAVSVAPPGGFDGFRVTSGHTCAIRVDGALECWGGYPDGSFPSAPPAGAFTAVDACGDYACAIAVDGTLHCWGAPMVPALTGVPSGTFTQVRCAASHACAIATDGTINCWGDNTNGTTVAPAGPHSKIAASFAFNCAIAADESVACWGAGLQDLPPLPVGQYRDLVARGRDICALKVDGTLVCVGEKPIELNGRAIERLLVPGCGVLRDGSLSCWDNSWGAPPAGPPNGYARASMGPSSSCGIGVDGAASCSINTRAHLALALGRISTGPSATCGIGLDHTISCWPQGGPTPTGGWNEISTGEEFACALSAEGAIACWGAIDPPPSQIYTTLSAGRRHACAIDEQHHVVCWGEGRDSETASPPGTFLKVSAGDRASCAIDSTGALQCWGMGIVEMPPTGSGFTEVSVGSGFACALGMDGQPTCWGKNDEGQLFPGPDRLISISAGRCHACGLGVDGRAHCWGKHRLFPADAPALAVSVSDDLTCVVDENHHPICSGERADRTPILRTPPEGHLVQVVFDGNYGGPDGYGNCAVGLDGRLECTQKPPIPEGDTTAVALTNGGQSGCALRRDGQLACWGLDPLGMAKTSGSFRALSGAGDKMCALKSDGAITCLGSAYADANRQPIEPPRGSFDALSVAADHACALRGDHVQCWGADEARQSHPPGGRFLSVAAGQGFSCGVTTDRRIGCWGTLPFPAPRGEYASFDVGQYAGCGATLGGELYCSGLGNSGTPGTGFPP